MARGADLFVVCKNPECGQEVSPYITECPYCGTRLRKRAPRLERVDRPAPARRRAPAALGRLRSDEIPGIRGDARPLVTAAVILLTCGVWIGWRGGFFSLQDLGLVGPIHGDWWRLASTQFVYHSGVYQFGALTAIAVFGWLLERRHGHVVVLALFLACGAGGAAVEMAAQSYPLSLGANGAALGLLCAWAYPDLRSRRAAEYYEGDLLATMFAFLALLALPLVLDEVSPDATAAGALIGLLAGALLHALRPGT